MLSFVLFRYVFFFFVVMIWMVVGEFVGERLFVFGEIGGDCVDEIELWDDSEICDELLVLGWFVFLDVGV